MSEAHMALAKIVLIAAAILFVIGLIGNFLSFSNRFVNALVTAVVFALIYGALYFVVDPSLMKTQAGVVSQAQWFQMVGIAAGVVFVVDLIANILSFQSRVGNALMTAVVFAVLFGGLMYATGGVPTAALAPVTQ